MTDSLEAPSTRLGPQSWFTLPTQTGRLIFRWLRCKPTLTDLHQDRGRLQGLLPHWRLSRRIILQVALHQAVLWSIFLAAAESQIREFIECGLCSTAFILPQLISIYCSQGWNRLMWNTNLPEQCNPKSYNYLSRNNLKFWRCFGDAEQKEYHFGIMAQKVLHKL